MSLLAVTSGSSGSSLVTPEGIDFDGVTDYLSRNTCLSGGVATKTFTFSCFVYNATSSETRVVAEFLGDLGAGYNIFRVIVAENNIQLIGYNQSISIILNCSVSTGNAPKNSWYNFICSVDLSNSSKRHMYINDVSKGVFDIFTNDSIAFNKPSLIYIGKPVPNNGNLNFKGRLSNVFLDYTYRDLSIEANRRLFITADGKPTPTATLKALNPILYLPMKDSATAHINEGTGGNFTLNGTIATSNRGANQDNCVASKFDGVNDYLSRTSLAGVIDSQYITFSCIYNKSSTESSSIVYFENGTQDTKIEFNSDSIRFQATAAGGTNYIFSIDLISTAYFVYGKSYNISFSYGGVGTYKIIINGIDVSSQAHVNVDNGGAIGISGLCYIARANSVYFNGNIGELYFDTKYIDLATSNPFWDKDTNRPKPLRQVIRENPDMANSLIILPLDASNPGKNYGTGGDFTANSAPYVGARGGSEFWARSISSGAEAAYLNKSTLNNLQNTKTFSIVFATMLVATTDKARVINFALSGETQNIFHLDHTNSSLNMIGLNSNGDYIYHHQNNTSLGITAGTWNIFMISVDLNDILKQNIYWNGVSKKDTNNYYVNDYIRFSSSGNIVIDSATQEDFSQSLCYFTTDYIDFSQEVNRLKFVDGLGMPLDLAKQIDAGVIPTPLIYLPFDDPSNLGKNLGTGGDFTVNGTVTQGSDFSI